MAHIVDFDQMPCSAVSGLGLHCPGWSVPVLSVVVVHTTFIFGGDKKKPQKHNTFWLSRAVELFLTELPKVAVNQGLFKDINLN